MQLPLDNIIGAYDELMQKLAGVSDPKDMMKLGKEQKNLQPQFELAKLIKESKQKLLENTELLETLDQEDIEMLEMAQIEKEELEQTIAKSEKKLLTYLTPTDPKDQNNVILEIRAGAGGDESSLFSGEMLRMYDYLAGQLGFKLKTVSTSASEIGGYKEIIAEITGDNVYAWFKYEAGVHRVQRVPQTEKQGRIHTSTVSVAVMPLVESDGDFRLDPKEIEVIITTSGGKGGQSVNTTYSAVQLRHTPTGIEAQSQDERSQVQNRAKAMDVLTARVFDHFEQERLAKESAERLSQVGRNDRSEKIRTYNFPQDRVTDHRYQHSWNNLPGIMDGAILGVLEDIRRMEAERELERINEG